MCHLIIPRMLTRWFSIFVCISNYSNLMTLIYSAKKGLWCSYWFNETWYNTLRVLNLSKTRYNWKQTRNWTKQRITFVKGTFTISWSKNYPKIWNDNQENNNIENYCKFDNTNKEMSCLNFPIPWNTPTFDT